MGGAEVFTYEVAKRWVALGHDVTLFTSKFPGCIDEETVDGIKIVRSGGRFTVYRQAKKYYTKRFRKESYEIIIDEVNTQPFFAQKFVKNGERIVALIHQLAREFWFYETPFPVNYLGFHYLENRWLKQYVDVPTITVSQSTQDDLKNLGFRNISIVSQGLNFGPLTDLPQKNQKPIIVFFWPFETGKAPRSRYKSIYTHKRQSA